MSGAPVLQAPSGLREVRDRAWKAHAHYLQSAIATGIVAFRKRKVEANDGSRGFCLGKVNTAGGILLADGSQAGFSYVVDGSKCRVPVVSLQPAQLYADRFGSVFSLVETPLHRNPRQDHRFGPKLGCLEP